MSRQVNILLLVILVTIAGCATESTVLPPAELTDYPARAEVVSVWKNYTGSAHPNGSQFFRPHVTDDTIYTVNRESQVTATDKSNGREIWKKQFDVEFLAGVSGNESALYVTGLDGALLAIDKNSGDALWQIDLQAEALSPPAATEDILISYNNDGSIVGLATEDGSELWRYSYKKPILTLHGNSRPRVVPGGVLIGLDDGSLVALTLDEGKLIWQTQISRGEGRSEIERLADIDGFIEIDQQFIYAVNYQGKIAQIEPSQGKVIWSRPMSSTSGVSVDNKFLYVTEPDGYVWALDKRTGASLWKMEKLEGRRLTRPIPYKDYVLVGDLEGFIHLLSKADGSQVARIEIDSTAVVSEPIVSDDRVFVHSRGGAIHELTISAKP